MRLTTLELHNFMPYKGNHKVNFEVRNNAQVVLFLGDNGHGKSSILHAIRWCLYGETKVNKKKKGTDKLFNRVVLQDAKENPDIKMTVKMGWITDGVSYLLSRSTWFPKGASNLTEAAELRINGGNPVSEASIPTYVRQFLPPEISHLFLFDGESQREFDDMNSSNQSAEFIKAEIESTLSIPMLKLANKWLSDKSTSEANDIAKVQRGDAKAVKLQADLQQSVLQCDVHDAEITNAKQKMDESQAVIYACEDALGDVEAFQKLKGEIDTAVEARKGIEDAAAAVDANIRQHFSSNLWLPTFSKLKTKWEASQNQQAQQSKLQSQISRNKALIQIQSEMKESDTCAHCGSKIQVDTEAIDSKIRALDEENAQLLTQLSTSHMGVQSGLLKVGFGSAALSNVANWLDDRNDLRVKFSQQVVIIQGLEAKLSDLKGNNLDTDQILNDYKAASKTYSLAKDNHRKHSDLKIAELANQANLKEQIAKIAQVSPQKKKTLDAYSLLEKVFAHALDSYVEAARKSVETKASETFTRIISDPKWTGIRISESFGAEPIMVGDLQDEMANTGTKKAVAVSLVDGLIRTALPGGFVLMDSPTGSLGKANRSKFLKWAGTSEMAVSLFVHDGEYNDAEERINFAGAVGRIYQIDMVSKDESLIKEIS